MTTAPPNPTNPSAKALTDLLECPVCLTVMHPPINQCPNGHAICATCKEKVRNTCPMCREFLGNIRCIALEKVAETLALACRYEYLGCREPVSYGTAKAHELTCKFRPYSCPTAGVNCTVTGGVQALVSHLKDDHKVEMIDGSAFSHRYVKSNIMEDKYKWMIHVYNCFGHSFCLHFEAFSMGLTPVFIAFVRIMGENGDGLKFRYSLEVEGRHRKMTWQGIPRSIRESSDSIVNTLDGLIIPRSTALFFSDDNNNELNIRLSGRIWEESV